MVIKYVFFAASNNLVAVKKIWFETAIVFCCQQNALLPMKRHHGTLPLGGVLELNSWLERDTLTLTQTRVENFVPGFKVKLQAEH